MRPYVLLVVWFIPAVALAQDGAWVGKTVFTKYRGIGLRGFDDKGKLQVIAHLNDNITYRVLEEKGSEVRVVTSYGKIGWAHKVDLMPAEQAVKYFSSELGAFPERASLMQKRAYAYELQGKFTEAKRDLDDMIHHAFDSPFAWNQRAGFYLANNFDKALAIEDFNKAIKLLPWSGVLWANRAYAHALAKKYDKALDDIGEAILLDPLRPATWNIRGMVYFLKGDFELALTDFDVAEKMNPHNAHVFLNRARMLATCKDVKYRDGKKAIELAKQALLMEPNPSREFFEALAAALAETGNFTEALRLQNEVLRDPRWSEIPDAIARRDLYHAKKKFREP